MELSYTEENYLKQIYRLSKPGKPVNTNSIAVSIRTKASSVTDMLDRLAAKKLVEYEKYRGVVLTLSGKKTALKIVRKHRLWEVFLVSKLGFTWDKVHDIAEQLEHIRSEELVERLDEFLDHPKFDPHGDPIPDRNGHITGSATMFPLKNARLGFVYRVANVIADDEPFLRFLSGIGLELNTCFQIIQRFDYNNNIEIEISAGNKKLLLDENTQNKIMIVKHT
jgi:DtxR family Mn-dependent transcriptional regulator